MNDINAVKINHFDFTLSKKDDLIFHEGPILTHFTNEYGWDFFMYWCDNDAEFNRWLLFRIDNLLLKDFFLRKKSLRQLILNNRQGFVYLIDINENIEYTNKKILSINEIPIDYLPSINSFFDEFHYEEYAKILRKETFKNQSVTNQKEADNLIILPPIIEKYNNKKTIKCSLNIQEIYFNQIKSNFWNSTKNRLTDNYYSNSLNTLKNVYDLN